MNILITGANGFIGSHLSNFLNPNHNVIAASKQQLNLMDTAAVDLFFDQYQIDVVIHCALTGREQLFDTDPKWIVDGLLMWRNLYNNRHKFGKLIQFATAFELDLNQPNVQITQSDILKRFPVTSYGYAKNLIARSVLDTEDFYNLRLFGNFHPSEASHRFFKKLSLSSSFTINQNKVMDYFYLEDIFPIVDAIIHNRINIRDINLVYNKKYSLADMCNMFCEINSIQPVITVLDTAPELTGSSESLSSLNLKLRGLEHGFSQYSKL